MSKLQYRVIGPIEDHQIQYFLFLLTPAKIPIARNKTKEGIPILPEVLLAIILINSKIEMRRIIFSMVMSIFQKRDGNQLIDKLQKLNRRIKQKTILLYHDFICKSI
jgi:hypothetical protein